MTLTGILASVITIPMGFMIPGSNYRCDVVIGSYDTVTRNIYVCEGVHEFTKHHEVAHYYWYNKLTEKERTRYTKEYNKAKSFFREYSSNSAEEDFADAYGTRITKSYLEDNKINRELRLRQNLATKLISKYY